MTPKTAATMREMLRGVVEFGTGKAAQMAGYSAAGKTGTGQKVDPDGRYSHTHYVASFIGMAPASRPAVTILVSIDTPHGAIYGAEVAAPAWKQIAQQVLSYLNVPRDEEVNPPLLMASTNPPTAILPGITQASQVTDPPATASQVTKAAALPTPGTPPAGRTVVISDAPLVVVPDFSGLNERKVADQCQKVGLQLDLSGLGLAVAQMPDPGTRVAEGSAVEVQFAR